MALTRVSGPVARRFHDRLRHWMLNGPYLSTVREISVGILPSVSPAQLLGMPITLFVAAYPTSASGAAAAGVATSTTEYTGSGEIAVVGSNLSTQDGYFGFVDALDDLVKLICEVEQKTQWAATSGTYGETVRIQSNGTVEIEWPSIKDESGAFYHYAVMRWPWKAYIAWE